MADLLDQGVILIPYEEDEASSCSPFVELGSPLLITTNNEVNPAEGNIDGPLVRSEIDLPEGPIFRFQAYRQAWEECLERTKKILFKLQKPIAEKAVHCSDRAFARNFTYYFCKTLTCIPDDEDPDDNPVILSQIHETDCANLTSMIKALISGFINFPLYKKPNFKHSYMPSDMQILVRYLEEVKIQYGPQAKVLMLIVLPDVSLIDPTLLSDVLDLCHFFAPALPFTFLTTSSDTDYFHRVLPRSTLTKLRLERFQLPCDRQTFEYIIEETFFSPEFSPRLMIGPPGLEMIISEFSRNNATLDSLLSNIQILYLQHFYNPLSFLCVPVFDNTLANNLQTSEDTSSWIPFMKLVRLKLLSKDISESIWSDSSPSKTLEKAIEGRKLFQNRMRHTKVSLRIWNIIRKYCRTRNSKFQDASSLQVSIEVLQTGMADTFTDIAISSIKSLDEIQAKALLEELYFFVHDLPHAIRNLTTGLKRQIVGTKDSFTLDKLESFCDYMARYFRATLIPFNDIPLLDIWWTNDANLPNSPFNPNVHVSIVTALLEPRGYLDWGMLNSSAEACPLPDVSVSFQRYVNSGKMINLYDWHQSFSTAFGMTPDQKDDAMDVDGTPTKHRHKKSTRLSNSNKSTDNKTSMKVTDKRELQARFMRTVHELEFVGFLKRTGRRVEHVTKTIFDVMD